MSLFGLSTKEEQHEAHSQALEFRKPPNPDSPDYVKLYHDDEWSEYLDYKRNHEIAIAKEELSRLQKNLRACVYKEGISSRNKCQPIVDEILSRMNWIKKGIPPPGVQTRSVVAADAFTDNIKA